MLIDASYNIPTLIYEVTWPITWPKTNEIRILYRKTDFCISTNSFSFLLVYHLELRHPSNQIQVLYKNVKFWTIVISLLLIYVHRRDLGYTTGIPVITMAKNSNKLVCELLWHSSSKILLGCGDLNFPGLQSLLVSESSSDSSPMSNRTACGLLQLLWHANFLYPHVVSSSRLVGAVSFVRKQGVSNYSTVCLAISDWQRKFKHCC